jgi:hypothetical protein
MSSTSFIDDRAAHYGTQECVSLPARTLFRIYNLMRDIDVVDWEELLGRHSTIRRRGLMHVPHTVINKLFIETHPAGRARASSSARARKFTPYLHQYRRSEPGCGATPSPQANEAYQTMLEYAFDRTDANVSVLSLPTSTTYGFTDQPLRPHPLRPQLRASVMVVDFDQTFMCREFEMVAAENLLFHLNSNGRLMIVLPARATYAAGNVKQLRDFIQDMYKLEEIAELPEGCFEGIGIKAYLFSITTGITDDVTVRRYIAASTVTGSGGRIPQELKMSEETFVMASELAEQGDWNIDKVFAAQDADWQKFMNVKKIALRDVAQVFRGKNVPQKDPTGNIGVVNISNLKEYTIDYDSLDHYSCEERKLVSYILEDGDIIIPARGTALRTAVFQETTLHMHRLIEPYRHQTEEGPAEQHLSEDVL